MVLLAAVARSTFSLRQNSVQFGPLDAHDRSLIEGLGALMTLILGGGQLEGVAGLDFTILAWSVDAVILRQFVQLDDFLPAWGEHVFGILGLASFALAHLLGCPEYL